MTTQEVAAAVAEFLDISEVGAVPSDSAAEPPPPSTRDAADGAAREPAPAAARYAGRVAIAAAAEAYRQDVARINQGAEAARGTAGGGVE